MNLKLFSVLVGYCLFSSTVFTNIDCYPMNINQKEVDQKFDQLNQRAIASKDDIKVADDVIYYPQADHWVESKKPVGTRYGIKKLLVTKQPKLDYHPTITMDPKDSKTIKFREFPRMSYPLPRQIFKSEKSRLPVFRNDKTGLKMTNFPSYNSQQSTQSDLNMLSLKDFKSVPPRS